METQRTRPTTHDPARAATGDEAPAGPGGSSLAQQARGYAEVARRAREKCQHGHAAEQELHQRRNPPGQ
jgi:hypothetical protein